MFKEGLRSKFLGCMVGAAIGDAVGAFFEGRWRIALEEVAARLLEEHTLRYTDDTEMTIGLAESIIRNKRVEPDDLIKTFIENFEPSRGYGWGTIKVLRRVERGESWREASGKAFGGEGSFGNGAAMRVSPVGLFYYDDPEGLVTAAELSSLVTHSHPLGIEGAVVQAYSVSMAVKSDLREGFRWKDLLDDLIGKIARTEVFRRKLQAVRELLTKKVDREEVVEKLGNGVEAFNSVPTAIYIFLKNSRDFKAAILNAVCLGGDTDTIASMVGALSGSYLGFQAIPDEWFRKLEDGEYIRSLAEKLWETKVSLISR
ncbi:ADP-ribosylglycohydrolase family protein [Candidatus Bathyarchaeota archaeon]|nr:ADP-ribosylglycohydrolase family protein [Candidatus Bathyarchaeota archaeon]